MRSSVSDGPGTTVWVRPSPRSGPVRVEIHIARAAASEAGTDHLFLINFLPSVIYEPEFCLRTTVSAIEGTGLRPEQIIFEVVETEAIEDHDHLRDILCYYRNNGFGVALDDLGCGYSGLSLMADLDPDLIKIDRGVVARADESEGHAEVCRAIIGLARSPGAGCSRRASKRHPGATFCGIRAWT